jgi:hypothetical protein
MLRRKCAWVATILGGVLGSVVEWTSWPGCLVDGMESRLSRVKRLKPQDLIHGAGVTPQRRSVQRPPLVEFQARSALLGPF